MRIRDPKSSLELTSGQWAKRILAQLAVDHPETVERYLSAVHSDFRPIIRKEVNDLSTKLLKYRGVILNVTKLDS